MTGLRVATFDCVGAFDDLAAEWAALDALRSPRVPFTSPLWNQLWWRHYRRNGWQGRDELRLQTVRDETGMLVAVAPMMLTFRPGRGALRTSELQFLGADSNVTELRGPLLRPGYEAAALQALRDHVEATAEWDWIQWRGLPAALGPAAMPDLQRAADLVDMYLPLERSWEMLRAKVSRNLKESLRKCYNSLSRDGHEWSVEVIEDPASVSVAFRQLLELHAARARLVDTVDHIDVFAAPEAKAFISDFVGQMAAAGQVRLFALEIGGVQVAMRIGFIYAHELYLYYSGYEPEWGRYSVMTTLVAEAVKWAIGQGLDGVNLSTGVDTSKTRWRPLEVRYVEGFQAAESIRGRVALKAVGMVLGRRPVRVA